MLNSRCFFGLENSPLDYMLVDIYILNADIAPKKPTGALIPQWGQKAGNSSWFWLQDQVQSLEDQ